MDNKGFSSGEPVLLKQASFSKPLEDTTTAPPGEEPKLNDVTVEFRKTEYEPMATEPYAGMGKEDLLRFSSTPFWVRLRMVCLILFWLSWAALLAAVVGLTIVHPRCQEPPNQVWWEKSSFYQIYVNTFYDADGDGTGDLKGVEAKLDYIKEIRADAVVLSSIYQSPDNGDFGYDYTSHTDVNGEVGTEADLDSLIAEAHRKNLKVIVDFIPNYTGKDHQWFDKSKRRDTGFENFYVWADCTTSLPPNNWRSVYGGSAWTYDSTRGQCYLHQFLTTQPELNLRSAIVREELEGILYYWLNKSVDGFRVIDSAHLYEDYDMRNESQICAGDDYVCLQHDYTYGLPENHALIADWRALIDQVSRETNRTRVLITDGYDNVNNTMDYYGLNGGRGSSLPINYILSTLNESCSGTCVKDHVEPWIRAQPNHTTGTWLTGSQDLPRIASSDSRVVPVLVLRMTLPGVPFTYYGEEIGMTNVTVTEDKARDPARHNHSDFSRDGFRTPMQWSTGPLAGFSNFTGAAPRPWLPLPTNYNDTNVQVQNGSATSAFRVYKDVAALRATEHSFHYGNMHLATVNENMFSFVREFDGKTRFLVAINFGTANFKGSLRRSSFSIEDSAQCVVTSGGGLAKGTSYNLNDVTVQSGHCAIFKWDYSR